MATRLDQMLMDFDEKRPGGPKKVKMGPEDRRDLQRVLSPEEFAAERVVPKGPTPLQVNATMPDRINPLPAGLEPPNPEQAGGRGILQRLADPRNRAPISQFMGTLAARIDPNGLGAALGGTAAEQAESSLVARALEGDESAYKYLAPERVAQIESLQAQREEVERRREAGERDEARVGLEGERVGLEGERVGIEAERVRIAEAEQQRKEKWDGVMGGILEGRLSVEEGQLGLDEIQKDINMYEAKTNRIAAEALSELRRAQAKKTKEGGAGGTGNPLLRASELANSLQKTIMDPTEAMRLYAVADFYEEQGQTDLAKQAREAGDQVVKRNERALSDLQNVQRMMGQTLGIPPGQQAGGEQPEKYVGPVEFESEEEARAANPPPGTRIKINGQTMIVE